MKKTLSKQVLTAHRDYITGIRLHNLGYAVKHLQSRREAISLFELISLIKEFKGDKSGRLSQLLKRIKAKLITFEEPIETSTEHHNK